MGAIRISYGLITARQYNITYAEANVGSARVVSQAIHESQSIFRRSETE
jgi:hypothetical protein